MVEQRSPKPMVGGSNPSAPATFHLDEKNYMNTHQQQLLQLLKIQPYQLHADFSAFSAITPDQIAPSLVDVSNKQRVASDDAQAVAETVTPSLELSLKSSELPALQQLQQDIQLLLQAELPTVDWQPSAAHTACRWQGHILQTPEIQALCSATQKKQLWMEFIKAQEQIDGSSDSSSHVG